MAELIVLVDEDNTEVGTAEKSVVHTIDTPLHRGFSLFIFNANRQLLITKRSPVKKTFPDVWTNTVCGHPAPEELVVDAAKRRLRTELGIDGVKIQEMAPYRYRFADRNGVVENEICPILVGYHDGDPKPNLLETDAWKWMVWDEFLVDTKKYPEVYSPWCVEEGVILSSLSIPVFHP